MSSTTSDVIYTSVYTDSEPGRAFWGADYEGISEGGIPPVIVLGYDGLRLQPAHDPDYVLEPIYPEYIPLEDNHEFSAEEQPLPPVDSPNAESPGYITESDPEEDPEEYEDDETKDGLIDYPMDGGDDGDDDDGDSSRDDARDEDEDEEDEEEEEPVFPPEGTEPIIPPPSTDITIGARITIRPQTSISLPPEAEVEKLLAMTTPSPSLPSHYHHPSVGEPLLLGLAWLHLLITTTFTTIIGYLTQTQTLKDSNPLQALIDVASPKEVHFVHYTLQKRDPERVPLLELVKGQRIDYGFVSMVDAEERRQGIRDVGYGIRDTWVDPAEAVPEIAPMTVGEVNIRVVELVELHERDTQDLYALLRMPRRQSRDSMDGGGRGLCFPRGLGSFDRIEPGDSSGAATPRESW
ncbi:hypothetical protein Tco_0611528 [Tanacetum coccineum]